MRLIQSPVVYLKLLLAIVSWSVISILSPVVGLAAPWSTAPWSAIPWYLVVADQPPSTQTAPDDAEALFRAAYGNRYTWGENFPGYAAEVTLRQGERSYVGTAELMPDFGVVIKNIAEETIRQTIVAQLQMSATHLQSVGFDQVHQGHSFQQIGSEPDGTVQIQELDDPASPSPTQSSYRVKQQQIRQVNRVLGDLAVEVNTLEVQQTPVGYLTNHFQVIFRDAKTNGILEQDDVQDRYSRVGSYYILAQRDIRAKQGDAADNLTADYPATPDTKILFDHVQLKA